MNQNVTDKKNVLAWYEKSRNNVFKLFRGFSIFLFVTTLLSVIANLDASFLIGKPSVPAFDEFYKTWIDGRLFDVLFFDVFVATVIIFMFSHIRFSVEQKKFHGVVLYNIALITQLLFVMKSLVMNMVLFGRFPILGILYVPYIIFAILIFVLNILHYMNYKDSYVYQVGYGDSLAIIIVCVCIAVATSVAVGVDTNKKMRGVEDKFIASEFRPSLEVLRVFHQSSVEDSVASYIGLQYVNLFNDRGRVYTVEELDEAFYNKESYGDKTYYRREAWSIIAEINSDLEAIEEKYNIYPYSYESEKERNYEVFRRLVYRRLDCLGQYIPSYEEPINYQEIDEACQYVYDMIMTGKSMEELGSSGEEIELAFSQDIKAGTKGFYDVDINYENTYASIVRWARVAYVGSEDEIERFYPHYGGSEFTFEDGCVYKAEIEVYPEITYYFNEGMKASVTGVADDSFEFRTYDNIIYLTAWVTVGDEIKAEDVQNKSEVIITGLEGVKVGDDIYEAQDISLIGINDNIVCANYYWSYYKDSEVIEDYYASCDPESEDEDSIKEFSLDYPAFQAEFAIYSDTGYKFAEALKVTYNGRELTYYEHSNLVPDVEIYGHYLKDGAITVGVNFYRIRFEGNHGTVVANYDFATEGTTITLTPIPEEGYRFVGYETSHDLRRDPDSEVEIIDDTFVMKNYPVVITGIFEEE